MTGTQMFIAALFIRAPNGNKTNAGQQMLSEEATYTKNYVLNDSIYMQFHKIQNWGDKE